MVDTAHRPHLLAMQYFLDHVSLLFALRTSTSRQCFDNVHSSHILPQNRDQLFPADDI